MQLDPYLTHHVPWSDVSFIGTDYNIDPVLQESTLQNSPSLNRPQLTKKLYFSKQMHHKMFHRPLPSPLVYLHLSAGPTPIMH
eukprot:6474577-Amphidinium_carterae.1